MKSWSRAARYIRSLRPGLAYFVNRFCRSGVAHIFFSIGSMGSFIPCSRLPLLLPQRLSRK